jgi:hypothetical protein
MTNSTYRSIFSVKCKGYMKFFEGGFMEGLSANYYVLTRVNRYQTLHSYFQGIMGTVDMLLAGAPSINLRLIAT